MPGGRKPKFATVEALEAAIEDYFETADARGWPYTVPDLSLTIKPLPADAERGWA